MIVVLSPVCVCGVAPHNLIPQEKHTQNMLHTDNMHSWCCITVIWKCSFKAHSHLLGALYALYLRTVCHPSYTGQTPLQLIVVALSYTAVCWQLPAHTACCASTLHSGAHMPSCPASFMLLINAHKATHTHTCSCPTAPQCGKLCSQHTQPRHPHMHTCPQHISCCCTQEKHV